MSDSGASPPQSSAPGVSSGTDDDCENEASALMLTLLEGSSRRTSGSFSCSSAGSGYSIGSEDRIQIDPSIAASGLSGGVHFQAEVQCHATTQQRATREFGHETEDRENGMIPCIWAGFCKQDNLSAGVVWDANFSHLEVVLCKPELADSDLHNTEQLRGKMAVAKRGVAPFSEKAQRVIEAGALGLIIVNTDDDLFEASGYDGYCAEIPVVMIKASDANALLACGNSSCLEHPSSSSTQPALTARQEHVCNTLNDLTRTQNWLALAELEPEACIVAGELRAAMPAVAAGIYGNLGACYHSLGQYAKAIDLIEESRSICGEVGNRARQGKLCANLGNCYRSLGQYHKAIALHQQALAIAEKVGDRVGQGMGYSNLGNCYRALGEYHEAIALHERALAVAEEVGDRAGQNCYHTSQGQDQSDVIEMSNRAGQATACANLGSCYRLLGQYDKAIELHEQALGVAEELGNRAGEGTERNNLGLCYRALGAHAKAIALQEQAKAIAEEVGDRVGLAEAWSSLGACLGEAGDAEAAARALVRGMTVYQSVERDVGAEDERRVAVFEGHQETYARLQRVLLAQGHAEWALGVAAQAKARALSHRLADTSRDEGSQLLTSRLALDSTDAPAPETEHQAVCEAWWADVQGLARAEGCATRVVEFSFLGESQLAIWVLSGAGELLCSACVPSSGLGSAKGHTIQTLLAETRVSMRVQGRDALVGSDSGRAEESWERKPLGAVNEVEASAQVAARVPLLLRELYHALLQPVEKALAGAEELLVVPHRELFEVPWAALLDDDGRYLVERHVIRVAPSLRVARQAADNLQRDQAQPGHAVVVGNPWPNAVGSLKGAEEEAKTVALGLSEAALAVRMLLTKDADKDRVKQALEGASWAHFACHGDKGTDSLVLANAEDRRGSRVEIGCSSAGPDLSMQEVQGSDRERGVELRQGATVVLSACNTGQGEIKAEGVVGLARGFLLANAAATVVSLWSVDDGSTKALMEHMYKGLCVGLAVPHALRAAMLHLAQRLPASHEPTSALDTSPRSVHHISASRKWQQPMHWAGFLVVGASTRLPRAVEVVQRPRTASRQANLNRDP